MSYSDLFAWWSVSIVSCAVFLIAVSLYLYHDRRRRHAEPSQITNRFRPLDFVFIWALTGLLGLYLVSISRGSSLIFAAGNVVVETLLVIYAFTNRST